MDVDELVAWLRGVLDELERAARGAEHPPGPQASEPQEGGLAEHRARNGPGAVLARVGAERRILAAYERAEQLALATREPQVERDAAMIWQAASWLAYGHRHDAPGWRPEWAPEGADDTTEKRDNGRSGT